MKYLGAIILVAVSTAANSAVLYSSLGGINDFDQGVEDDSTRTSDLHSPSSTIMGVAFTLALDSTITQLEWAGYNLKCCNPDLTIGDQFPDDFTIAIYEVGGGQVGDQISSVNIGSSVIREDSGVDDFVISGPLTGRFFGDVYTYSATLDTGISLDAGDYLLALFNNTVADGDPEDRWWWAHTTQSQPSPDLFRDAGGEWAPTTSPSPRHNILTVTGTVVPIPAAVWLFGSALAGLAGFRRWRAAPARL